MTELVTGQFYWMQPASPLTGVQPALYAASVRPARTPGSALTWTSRRRGRALGGRRPAEPLLPHLTSAKLAGRHFEAGQKLDIALIASSGALADAGVPV
jgi:hypothetical protein